MATLKLNEKNQNYFCNLPYSNYNIIQIHGQFNNLMQDINLPSKRYLKRLPSFYDIDLFSLNLDLNFNTNSESFLFNTTRCKYYLPHSFNQL